MADLCDDTSSLEDRACETQSYKFLPCYILFYSWKYHDIALYF